MVGELPVILCIRLMWLDSHTDWPIPAVADILGVMSICVKRNVSEFTADLRAAICSNQTIVQKMYNVLRKRPWPVSGFLVRKWLLQPRNLRSRNACWDFTLLIVWGLPILHLSTNETDQNSSQKVRSKVLETLKQYREMCYESLHESQLTQSRTTPLWSVYERGQSGSSQNSNEKYQVSSFFDSR